MSLHPIPAASNAVLLSYLPADPSSGRGDSWSWMTTILRRMRKEDRTQVPRVGKWRMLLLVT